MIPFLIAPLWAVATANQTSPVKKLHLHFLKVNRKKKSTRVLPNFPGSWLKGISPSYLWGWAYMENSAGETLKLTSA